MLILSNSGASKAFRNPNSSRSSIKCFRRGNFYVHRPVSQFSSNVAFKSCLSSFVCPAVISRLLYPFNKPISSDYIICNLFIGACSKSLVTPTINPATNRWTMCNGRHSFLSRIHPKREVVHSSFNLRRHTISRRPFPYSAASAIHFLSCKIGIAPRKQNLLQLFQWLSLVAHVSQIGRNRVRGLVLNFRFLYYFRYTK